MHKIKQSTEKPSEALKEEIVKGLWRFFPRKVRRTFSEMIYLANDFDPRRPAIFISKFQSLLQERGMLRFKLRRGRSQPPPQAGCPLGDPGPLAVL